MARFAALNTDFVIALSGGISECEEAIDFLHSKLGFSFLITPVVEESLFWIHKNVRDSDVNAAATTAYGKLATYGIMSHGLQGVANTFTRNTAEKWRDEVLCESCHINDYLAVTEASYVGAELLITARPILKIDPKVLNAKLVDVHLNPLSVVDMWSVMKVSLEI